MPPGLTLEGLVLRRPRTVFYRVKRITRIPAIHQDELRDTLDDRVDMAVTTTKSEKSLDTCFGKKVLSNLFEYFAIHSAENVCQTNRVRC